MRSERHHQLLSLQVKNLSTLTIEGTSPTMLVSRFRRLSIWSTIGVTKKSNNRCSMSKLRRNHTKREHQTMMITSPKRQKVSLLTTLLRIRSTRESSRTRSPLSPKRSESQELRTFNSICWIQSIVSRSTSIPSKTINLMRWIRNQFPNKYIIMPIFMFLTSLSRMMDTPDKTSWPRRDQTPPSRRTVTREAVPLNCRTLVVKNILI